MKLSDLSRRALPPAPWSEGDNIPWHEPACSERMLDAHLSQAHDRASRRSATIDEQVAWICDALLPAAAARVLDLACGPGLYTSRLAARGHTCHGIDFAPAAVRYARETAAEQQLSATYELADLRRADFGGGHDLAMMLFGQINVFRRAEAAAIIARAFDALAPGGRLLLEPQRAASLEAEAGAPPGWTYEDGGLFSTRPHLLLTEQFWDARQHTLTRRFFVVDAATAVVTPCAMSAVAYEEAELQSVLQGAGFELGGFELGGSERSERPPPLSGESYPTGEELFVLVGHKPR